MAKLTKQKRSVDVGPVGVVRMSGLREMGEAWGQTSRTAQEFSQTLGTELGKRRVSETAEKFATTWDDPENEYIGSVAAGNENVVMDAAGRPKVIEGQVAPVMDNIFSNSYHKTWNEKARQHNTNTAYLQMESELERKYNQLNDTGFFDYQEFKAYGDAYIKQMLPTVEPSARAEVQMKITSTLTKNYYALMRQAEQKQTKEFVKAHEAVSEINRANLEQAIVDYGVEDPGTQQYFLAAALHEARAIDKLNLTDDQVAARINDQNQRVIMGQVINKINTLSKDGTYSEQDMLAVEQFVADIQAGKGNVTTFAFDLPNKQVGPQQVTFAQAIPDPKEREALFNDMAAVVRTQGAVARNSAQLQTSLITNQISLASAGYINGVVTGNNTAIDTARAEFKRIQDDIYKLDPMDQGKLALELAKTELKALSASEDLAQTQFLKDVQVPMMKKALSSLMNSLPESLQEQAQNYGINSDASRKFMDDPKNGPKDKISALSAQLTMLRNLSESHIAYMKEVGPMLNSMKNQDYIGHSKKYAATADSRMAQQALLSGQSDTADSYRPFTKTEDAYDWVAASNTAKPFINIGVVPEGIANQTRGFFANNDEQGIVASWRAFNDFRNTTGISLDDLEKGYGKATFAALTYLDRKFTYGEDFALNTITLENAKLLARGEKLETLDKADRKVAEAFFNEKITSIFGDDPRIPLEMRSELLNATAMKHFDDGYDLETSYEMVWEKFTDSNKPRWAVSQYGVQDKWNKTPIDRAYPLLSDDGTNPQFLNSRLRAALNAQTGGGFLAGFDTIINMEDVQMPNESTDYVDGKYQMRFMVHGQNEQGYPIYRPVIKSIDQSSGEAIPIYTAVTDSAGKLVTIDLTSDNQLEQDRRNAINDVDLEMQRLMMMRDEADQAYGIATAGALPVSEETYQSALGEKLRTQIEIDADLEALKQYKKNLDRYNVHGGSQFMREVYASYSGDNFKQFAQEINNTLNSMTEDEYAAFMSMPYEQQRDTAIKLGLWTDPFATPNVEVEGP